MAQGGGEKEVEAERWNSKRESRLTRRPDPTRRANFNFTPRTSTCSVSYTPQCSTLEIGRRSLACRLLSSHLFLALSLPVVGIWAPRDAVRAQDEPGKEMKIWERMVGEDFHAVHLHQNASRKQLSMRVVEFAILKCMIKNRTSTSCFYTNVCSRTRIHW